MVARARAGGALAILMTRPHRESEDALSQAPGWRQRVPDYNQAVRRVAEARACPWSMSSVSSMAARRSSSTSPTSRGKGIGRWPKRSTDSSARPESFDSAESDAFKIAPEVCYTPTTASQTCRRRNHCDSTLAGTPADQALASGLLLTCAMPALAQDTRAEEIARQQAEKARQLKPNVPTGMEKTLDRFEQYLTDPSTFYFTLRAPYPSSGPALGLAYRRAAGQARFNIGGSYSIRAINWRTRRSVSRTSPEANSRSTPARDGRMPPRSRSMGSGATRKSRPGELRPPHPRSRRKGHVKASLVVPDRRGVGLQRHQRSSGCGHLPVIGTVRAPAAPGLFDEARYTQLTAFTAIELGNHPATRGVAACTRCP